MAYLGKTPSQAVRSRYYFTASGGETSLSGTDDNSNTLTFTDGNYVDVSLNGVALVAGTDYNTTTANTIGGLTALVASDVVEVVVYDTFSVFSGEFRGDISLGDNVKAKFGASDDLQIYHVSADNTSRIVEGGSGNLIIQGTNLRLGNADFSKAYFAADDGGAATIYYNDAPKLATTSTGVDITGTLTSDGLAVGGSNFANTTYTGSSVNLTGVYTGLTSDGGFAVNVRDSGYLQFSTSNTERMRIDSSGNVGIGTSSPTSTASAGPTLEISGTAGGNLVLSDSNATTGQRAKYFLSQGGTLYIGHSADNGTSPVNDLVVDSNGNVGIGTTSPSSYNANIDDLVVSNAASGGITIATGTTSQGSIAFADGTDAASEVMGRIRYSHDVNEMDFRVNNAEVMRIDSSGNLLFEHTDFASGWGSTNRAAIAVGGNYKFWSSRDSTTSRGHIIFYNPNGAVGSITTSGSSTAFNTSSDHRLKENVTDVTDGITRVKQLEPKRFNFIADPDTTVDGFLAHQAQSVVPEAVTGTHNEVDDDGNAVMQGIDQSKLVPLLTAALKEAITKIETLETEMTSVKERLDALEAN